jgi:hypothetical protein
MPPIADGVVRSSIEGGQERARALVDRQPVAFGPPRGYLIAEGDSWFDYPFFQDILEALEDAPHNYRIRSAAHHGDTAESMAYEDRRLDKLRKVFAQLAEENDEEGSKTPRAILVSCGGNDVAYMFEMLLNHKASRLPVVNDDIVRGLLDVRVKAAISSLIGSVNVFGQEYFEKQIPILIHGYGAPVPDGRGFPVLGLSGPWLKPGFTKKGYVTGDPQTAQELQENAATMAALIDLFNSSVLAKLPQLFAGTAVVKYVDLRPIFNNVVAGAQYQQCWRDEMHATKKTFDAAAQVIAGAIP